jgi:hypothetical protein
VIRRAVPKTPLFRNTNALGLLASRLVELNSRVTGDPEVWVERLPRNIIRSVSGCVETPVVLADRDNCSEEEAAEFLEVLRKQPDMRRIKNRNVPRSCAVLLAIDSAPAIVANLIVGIAELYRSSHLALNRSTALICNTGAPRTNEAKPLLKPKEMLASFCRIAFS